MKRINLIFIITLISLKLISQTKEETKLIRRIEKLEINDLSMIIDSSYKSNEPISFKLELTDKKGNKFFSEGAINYMCFNVDSKIAKINKNGQLLINHCEIGIEKEITINMIKKGINSYSKNINIALNYEGSLNLDYSGKEGQNGKNGANGKKIVNDSIVSSGIGYNGEHGQSGENGHDIEVYLLRKFNKHFNRDLISITVKDNTDSIKCLYVTDPEKSDIYINVSGGKGGNGGHGGKGDKGDKNISGWIDTKPGYYGGNGGNGGTGGKCGFIKLYVDSSALQFKEKIQIIVKGGIGGKPGLPGERGAFGDSEYMGKTYSSENGYLLPKDLKYENEGAIGGEGECNTTPKVINAKLNSEY